MNEDDGLLGPGTDLVVSLSALMLVLLFMVIYFYGGATGVFSALLGETDSQIKMLEDDKRKLEMLINTYERASDDKDMEFGDRIRALYKEIKRYIAKITRLERLIDTLNDNLGKYKKSYKEKEDELAKSTTQVRNLEDLVAELNRQMQKLQSIVAKYESDSEEIIRFSELDGNKFKSGSAEVNEIFRSRLREEVVEKIKKLIPKYGADRVIVEVFGFTDGVPMTNRIIRCPGSCQVDIDSMCNIDETLVAFSRNNGEPPAACSNVELGKLRADVVAKQLRQELANEEEPRLSHVSIFGYSAGQTILPDDNRGLRLASVGDDGQEDARRRFVEVRLNIKPLVNQR
uniref:Predicted nucleic acid-binding protein, contains Zn-ribbon domain n=1 Tax=Candidatus Kentrum sp. LPFa TaxID=2126335 RepID=A0A450W1C7_9GAMM|nr:MAG: Predicted nucleic acid-binding protein, contains Zn-ribbon domain [Candidatus Kentron sp. LPFa]